MNEEFESENYEDKYAFYDIDDMQKALEEGSDTLSDSEKTYLKVSIAKVEEEIEMEKRAKEEANRKFPEADSRAVSGNVAIVLDLDETLVRRGAYLNEKDGEDFKSETTYTLARPGLFKFLDGLKKIKQEYEMQHQGSEFNIYAFTSGNHNNTEEFQSFIGEEYVSLFKDFYNRESDIFLNGPTQNKNIHLLPEDTVLYFGDIDASVIFKPELARDNQRILCYDIPSFKGDEFEYAVLLREYNRHLHKKIQEMTQNGDENANMFRSKLDKLGNELLDYFSLLKNSDQIDVLLDSISSQLKGQNTDKTLRHDEKSALKKVEIDSPFMEKFILEGEYEELFNEIYGKDSTVMKDIKDKVKTIVNKYAENNPFENPEARAKIHPAEVYPHSKRYMNSDIGEEKDEI